MLLVQRGGHGIDAAREHVAVLTQLPREAVARPLRRHGRAPLADGEPQRDVLTHQRDGLGPRRDRVDALGERHPDHRADRVARSAGPASRLKLGDERRNLRRVEQPCDLSDRRERWYLGDGHGVTPLWSRPPDVPPSRGSSLTVRHTVQVGSDGKSAGTDCSCVTCYMDAPGGIRTHNSQPGRSIESRLCMPVQPRAQGGSGRQQGSCPALSTRFARYSSRARYVRADGLSRPPVMSGSAPAMSCQGDPAGARAHLMASPFGSRRAIQQTVGRRAFGNAIATLVQSDKLSGFDHAAHVRLHGVVPNVETAFAKRLCNGTRRRTIRMALHNVKDQLALAAQLAVACELRAGNDMTPRFGRWRALFLLDYQCAQTGKLLLKLCDAPPDIIDRHGCKPCLVTVHLLLPGCRCDHTGKVSRRCRVSVGCWTASARCGLAYQNDVG